MSIKNIALSGFDPNIKSDLARKIQDLGAAYNDSLTRTTDILVVNSLLQEKSMTAARRGVPLATEAWIQACHGKGQIIDCDKYRPLPLWKLTIGLLDFEEEELKQISKVISELGGTAESQLTALLETQVPDLVILRRPENIKTFEGYFSKVPPFISIDWLYEVVRSRQFIPFLPFAPSFEYEKHLIEEEARTVLLEPDINNVLDSFDASDPSWLFLSDCVIYLAVGERLGRVLQKLIASCGGLHVKEVIPQVTHIVVARVTEEEIRTLSSLSRRAHLVTFLWLRDCFYNKGHVVEAFYRPRSALGRGGSTLGRPLKMNLSQNSHSEAESRSHVFRIHSNLAAESRAHHQPLASIRERVDRHHLTKRSNLFKNHYFYFEPHAKVLKPFKIKVLEHEGFNMKVFEPRENLLYVMDDDPKTFAKMDQLKYPGIRYISSRWIDYCLERKLSLLHLPKQEPVYVKPFPHRIPFEDFANVIIHPAGFSPIEKAQVVTLLELLGARVVFDLDVITHIVVRDIETKKLTRVRQCPRASDIYVLRAEWIHKSIFLGQRAPEELFLLDNVEQ